MTIPDEAGHTHKYASMPVPRFNLQSDPGSHTSFYVLFCECGHATVFPRSNYALLSPGERATFERTLLADFGLTLDHQQITERGLPHDKV